MDRMYLLGHILKVTIMNQDDQQQEFDWKEVTAECSLDVETPRAVFRRLQAEGLD